ncbi:MAG: hypothetical protein IPM06_22065 [Rhizobiales bacterium]|nr:hypothetical protein [Hyphomicrobiales bacterium]
MSNSTTNIDGIVQGQGSQDLAANAVFDAASPATLYGRRASTCSGIAWGYYGGNVLLNGVLTQIANGTITLTASTTNYIEANPTTGAVSKSVTGFTAGQTPLYTIVVGTATVTSYTDHRLAVPDHHGLLAKALASDANYTLTQAEARNHILQFTGTLTATRNMVLPLIPRQWTVYNGTGQSLQFIGASGTGITVATTKRAIIYSDGTNVVRVTADT